MIIFDFDGTIADTKDCLFGILNKLSKKYGFRVPEGTRDISTKELIRQMGIGALKLPLILADVRKEMGRSIETIRPFRGIRAAIKDMSERERLYIISSNSQENIARFLYHNRMDYFIGISSGSLFGKQAKIASLLKKTGDAAGRTYYVGDECRDIEAGRKAGIRCCAVTWGYNSKEVLIKSRPDIIVEKPKDLTCLSDEIGRP